MCSWGSLWALAVLAARVGAASGLVGATVLWGLAIPIIGVKQDLWLVGSAHWITKVVHLLTGVGAEGLAERLAASSRRPTAATQRTGHRAGTA